jgi:large subunit ribosomal protein L35
MAYKFKPNKSIAKRFKVTKTGKLKHHHAFTSHLMSARSGATKRHLRKASVLFEGHSNRLRKLMGISGVTPGKVARAKAIKAAATKGESK